MKIMTREEAIKILSTRDAHGVLCGYTSGVTEALDMAVEALRDKPRGEWLLECDGGNECDNLYKCSMCGVEYGCEEYDKPNFCPNCGTDMRNKVDGGRIMCDAMCDNVVSSNSIQREDAIEAIKFLPPYREYWKGTRKVLYTKGDIIKALKELPSAEAEWIPCSERLPSEPFGCIVTVEDSYFDGSGWSECVNVLPYFVGYDGTTWNDGDGEECPFEVIAWMPLPKPYREDGEI